MKYFPKNDSGVYKGKLRYNMSLGAWKKRLIMFAVANVITYFFMPAVFDGFWGLVGSISSKSMESRKVYEIRKRHGRTMADLYESVEIWKTVPSAINPMNWGR